VREERSVLCEHGLVHVQRESAASSGVAVRGRTLRAELDGMTPSASVYSRKFRIDPSSKERPATVGRGQASAWIWA